MSFDNCQCQMRDTAQCYLYISNLSNDDLRYCRRHQGCTNQLVSVSIDPKCDTLGGLTYLNNSCYLDSLLYAILHVNTPYINDYLIEADLKQLKAPLSDFPLTELPELYELTATIQQFLKKAQDTIQHGGRVNCRILRTAFKQYSDIRIRMGEKFEHVDWISEQLSPFDVITELNKIFSPPELTLIRSDQDTYVSYVIDIDPNLIAQFDQATMTYGDQQGTLSLKELIGGTIISTPILFIHVQRIVGHVDIPVTKITTVIMPESNIQLDNRKTLVLVSIIVHWGDATGGHYVTYIKCGQQWYFYNDINFTKLQKIGTFNDLLQKHASDITQNATGFYYISST